MNILWAGMILLSLLAGAAGGTLPETVAAGMEGARGAVETVLSFAGIMCLWSGFLRVAEEGGAAKLLSGLLFPITRLLFPRLPKNSEAIRQISLNMTANFLGTGNAATPAGIAAMCAMDRENPNPAFPTEEMCLFTVLNTASLQCIPTTILSLRIAAGSNDPTGILIPIWISSLCSLLTAVFCMKFILYLEKSRIERKQKEILDNRKKNGEIT